MGRDASRKKISPAPLLGPAACALLALFAVAAAFLGLYYLAAAEAVAALALFFVHRRIQQERRHEISKFIDAMAGSMDVAAKDTMVNSPLPMVIFRPESEEIIWTNDRFLRLTGQREHLFDTRLDNLVEGFSTRWLMEGKGMCPEEVTLGRRRFQVFGHLVRTGDSGGDSGYLATTYWVDVTDLAQVRDTFLATRPVVMLLLVDNYEESLKPLSDAARSTILSEIERRLNDWVEPSGGMFCRIDRDRYLAILDEAHFQIYLDEKFTILNTVRQASGDSSNPATLTIGAGRGAEGFHNLFHNASQAVDMALSRGGDQAVIRNETGFEFYGGQAKELEKRTKVKSRVMANILGDLIARSSCVFVMGHRSPDMDVVGACAGVCAMARKAGVKAYIVWESGNCPGKPLLQRLQEHEYYQNIVLSPQDAMAVVDPATLLVVVDTNRPDQVIAPALLESCSRVAVIDHHRRAADYIEGTSLSFHEPFASSASELVTELVQYQVDSSGLYRVEAEALLAGIMLDTKNFTLRTGGRTFEAAAFLRRAGADTAETRKLFQNDLASTISKYHLVSSATLYRDGLALAVQEEEISRVSASQAADELLNISGIHASFVVYQEGGVSMISARSTGDVNVQVILELLGGGGNGAAAGAQLPGYTVPQAAGLLRSAIDQYLLSE